jgi:hypothetical protein
MPTNPYTAAAEQTTASNIENARTATAANRVNQNTAYGSLNYTQGVDASGNPTWTANQSLNPAFTNTLNNIAGNVNATSANPFDASQYRATTVGNAPTLQTDLDYGGMAGWDKATNLLMERLNPQISQQSKAMDAKLAAQGVVPGTEAYNRAQMQLAQQQNDLRTGAQIAGQNVQQNLFKQALDSGVFRNTALTGQNTMNLGNTEFNNLAAGQNFKQDLTAYNNPLEQLNAFRKATDPGYVNPYSQATVAGTDYAGANATEQANAIAEQNAKNAASAATRTGLYNIGSSYFAGGGKLPGISTIADLYGEFKKYFNEP